MTAWSAQELERIGAADELTLITRRADGTTRRPVPIWVVRVEDRLYVRSWRGENAAWYRAIAANAHAHITSGGVDRDVRVEHVNPGPAAEIDAAYRSKYARYPTYVEPMLSAQARAATFALTPEQVSS